MLLVVFYPRVRSTVTMQIVDAMGYRVQRHPNNPNWEAYESGLGLRTKGRAERDALKISAPAFFRSQIEPDDRILFCLRPPAAIEDSARRAGLDLQAVRLNYTLIGQEFKRRAETLPNPIFILDTDALIADPGPILDKLKAFLGVTDQRDYSDLCRRSSTRLELLPEPEDAATAVHRHLLGRAA